LPHSVHTTIEFKEAGQQNGVLWIGE